VRSSWTIAALCTLLCTAPGAAVLAPVAVLIGSKPYIDHRDQPPYLALPKPLEDQYQLGHAVFNTPFVALGTPNAGRRAGLGPIFNAPSCDECHNEGAHGRGPDYEGAMPNSMVVQLEALPAGVSTDPTDPPGDPVYGRLLSPAAVEGFTAEGQVIIHYHVLQRTYPDGTAWTLRRPEYEITHLGYGPLAANVVIKHGRSGIRRRVPWHARWASPAPIGPRTTAPAPKCGACSSAIRRPRKCRVNCWRRC